MKNTYAYRVKHRNGWGTGFGPRPTHCHKCNADLPVKDSGGTGYGCGKSEPLASHPDAPALKPGESLERSPAVCYQCCADDERARMIETGRAMLYLAPRANAPHGSTWRTRDARTNEARYWYLTDWPGGLEFAVKYMSKGAHNMARTRYDVTFTGPDGKPWRGTQYGENTQICHCRRLGK